MWQAIVLICGIHVDHPAQCVDFGARYSRLVATAEQCEAGSRKMEKHFTTSLKRRGWKKVEIVLSKCVHYGGGQET